jgi:SAM-dependent methyltransferase
MMSDPGVVRRAAMYDDPDFDYSRFWAGRDYEHEAELLAIRRLLCGSWFAHAVNVGGGYGRLCSVPAEHAARVTLVDARSQQLALSEEMLPAGLAVARQLADPAQSGLQGGCADLVALIRVLQYQPSPAPLLAELARVLVPGVLAIVEVANSAHAGNRLAARMRGRRIPLTPVDLSSAASRRRGAAPFVHHHPRALVQQFRVAGLSERRVLSVSNMRHALAMAVLSERGMLAAERVTQVALGLCYFGPSIFFLLEKEPLVPPCEDEPADSAAAGLREHSRIPSPRKGTCAERGGTTW